MNRFTAILIGLCFFSCFSGIRKELNYSSDSIAFYSFTKSSELPFWIDTNAVYPTNVDSLTFIKVLEESLFQLGNRNDSLVNDTALRIFSKELSKEIANRSFEKLEQSPEQIYQLWILKKEDSINPGRRIRRTAFLLYPTSEAIHFIFFELNQFIDFQTPYTFQDWSNFSISESNLKPSLEVFIPDSAIGKLKYFKDEAKGEYKKFHILAHFQIQSDAASESSNPVKKINISDSEKRLIELKGLFDKKLISEEEYRKKREEILKSI
ncbi:SHOCT domain-containing protein [Leptospira sp. 201903070]|uniref:SHOCT domain-containing protein n=1 Tax=Leptospira ainlahdjerensis TaxID=2810033 RepID=A0ABS2U8M7_9LEPT|nr:SHOCT domain-containing protein [Leptospira ainlahdjerensis]MBM9576730.1 SHOCT domain-containing protein [Leptospira ainlahdjerensis]